MSYTLPMEPSPTGRWQEGIHPYLGIEGIRLSGDAYLEFNMPFNTDGAFIGGPLRLYVAVLGKNPEEFFLDFVDDLFVRR